MLKTDIKPLNLFPNGNTIFLPNQFSFANYILFLSVHVQLYINQANVFWGVDEIYQTAKIAHFCWGLIMTERVGALLYRYLASKGYN